MKRSVTLARTRHLTSAESIEIARELIFDERRGEERVEKRKEWEEEEEDLSLSPLHGKRK